MIVAAATINGRSTVGEVKELLGRRVQAEMDMTRCGGIVLCGGQSKRMGRAKAWLPIAGEFMLPRVVRLLRQVVNPVVVVAAPNQAVPPLPAEIAVIRDEESDRGPLQGLAAGFQYLKGQVEAAFASSCDVPFLQPAFVQRMIDLLGDYQICVPRVGELYQPLAAVYRLEVAATVVQLLAENRLRVSLLFDAAAMRVVQPAEFVDIDPMMYALRNLNTPEDYEAAVQDAGLLTTVPRSSGPGGE